MAVSLLVVGGLLVGLPRVLLLVAVSLPVVGALLEDLPRAAMVLPARPRPAAMVLPAEPPLAHLLAVMALPALPPAATAHPVVPLPVVAVTVLPAALRLVATVLPAALRLVATVLPVLLPVATVRRALLPEVATVLPAAHLPSAVSRLRPISRVVRRPVAVRASTRCKPSGLVGQRSPRIFRASRCPSRLRSL